MELIRKLWELAFGMDERQLSLQVTWALGFTRYSLNHIYTYVHELQFASEHIKPVYCSFTVRLFAMTDRQLVCEWIVICESEH